MAEEDDRDNDESETLVMTRRSVPNTAKPDPPVESGVVIVSPRAPPESVAGPQRIDEPKASRSFWERFASAAGRFFDSVEETFFGRLPPLTPYLPPVPLRRGRDQTMISTGAQSTLEQGEALFVGILRASSPYRRAAIDVATRAAFIKAMGEQPYADFVVHFVLSRIPPDKQGRIDVTRLRDMLPFMMYSGAILPALIRLEEQKIIRLVLGDNGGDPMTDILRERIQYVELRTPV